MDIRDVDLPIKGKRKEDDGIFLRLRIADKEAAKNLQVLQYSKHNCTVVHGHFEEITYQVRGLEQCVLEGVEASLSQLDGIHYADIWAQREGPKVTSSSPKDIHCNEVNETSDQSIYGKEERIISINSQSDSNTKNSFFAYNSVDSGFLDDDESEIRQELRWLKAKYQMQLRELRDKQLGVKPKSLILTQSFNDLENYKDNKASMSSILTSPKRESNGPLLKSLPSEKHLTSYFLIASEKKCASFASQGVQHSKTINGSYNPKTIATTKSFYTGALLPHPLHRKSSFQLM
ncbi:hypothetical protein CRYUN_Cryun36dG0054600 [Craigia yunnanensis]